MEEVYEAAKKANAHEFIIKMAEGYHYYRKERKEGDLIFKKIQFSCGRKWESLKWWTEAKVNNIRVTTMNEY